MLKSITCFDGFFNDFSRFLSLSWGRRLLKIIEKTNLGIAKELLALRATIYMALMGEKGMKKVIELCYQKSHYAANKIDQLKNYKIKFEKLFLKEFVVETDHNISKLQEYCYNSGFIISNINSKITNCFQIAITEKISKNDIDNFIICLKSYNE